MNNEPANALPVVETERFNEMRELMESDFAVMLQSFFTDASGYIENAQSLLSQSPSNAADCVHKLKGAALSLGATELANVSFLAMQHLRQSKLKQAKEELSELPGALERFKKEALSRVK